MGAFDASIGVFLVGALFAVFFLGTTVTQAAHYYNDFPNDPRVFFWMVTILMIASVFHAIISSYTVWLWAVENFGNVAILYTVPWSFLIEPALLGCIVVTVQLFYAYRVYLISARQKILPSVITGFALISWGFSIGATIEIEVLNRDPLRFVEWDYGVAIWFSSAVIADILISGSLIYYLRKAATHDRTKSIAYRIILNTIETNSLTCMVAISSLLIFATVGGEVHVGPQLSLPSLYINSLLVSLNARKGIAQKLNATHSEQLKTNEDDAATRYRNGVSVIAIQRETQTIIEDTNGDRTNGMQKDDKGSYEERYPPARHTVFA